MLTVVGDTHAETGHQLEGAVLRAVRDAELVVHTGDFTTPAVLDALETEAAELVAVAGNNDPPTIRDQLGDRAIFDALDLRFLVVHGHEHASTSLSMLARQEGADVAIVGHSHAPSITDGDPTTLNPGSYADPRWHRPAYATVETQESGVVARLRDPDGTPFDRTWLEGRS